MRKAALLVFLVFAGCVSTATFNKKVGDLKAGFKAENAALERQVNGLKGDRDFLMKMARDQDRISSALLKTIKYQFSRLRDYDNQLLTQGAGIEQVSKDLEDLDGRVEKLEKTIAGLKRELAKLKDAEALGGTKIGFLEKNIERCRKQLYRLEDFTTWMFLKITKGIK